MGRRKKFLLLSLIAVALLMASGCQKVAGRLETAGDELKSSVSGQGQTEMTEEGNEDSKGENHTLEENGANLENNDSTENSGMAEDSQSEENRGETEDGEALESAINPEGQKEKNPVTVVLAGDVLFSDGVLATYDKSGLEGLLDENLIRELNDADITVINNEFPFSERGTKAEDKQYTFRVSPERVHILQEMGVDVASLANNHSMDFGVEAMLDTIDTLKEAGIVPLGAGKDKEEAKQIAYMEKEGMTFAFLGASRVIPVPEWTAGKNMPGLLTTYDPTLLLEQIAEAKAKADYVIVYVHWGLEKESYPEEYQRSLGQKYIDAGADLVVGSHSHCLQGIEYYKDAPIVYSLGNFVFGSQNSATALLKVTFEEDKEPVLSVVPAKTVNFYTSTITEESELEKFYQFYEEISVVVTFKDGVVVRWQ